MSFDPKNINARLDNIERALFGYFQPLYVDDVKPTPENPTPPRIQHEENVNGKLTLVDTLEFVPGLVDKTAAAESARLGFAPAGDGVNTGAHAFAQLEGEKPAKKKSK